MSTETKRRDGRRLGGFTLIEAAAFLFVFSVITMTFYQLYAVGSRHMLDAKRRLGATALANQRLEIVRGMPYTDIGTKTPDGAGGWDYGIPAGEILEDEMVSSSGGMFSVHTFVQYADDPYDGEAGGTDPIPTDYKRVRIDVSWGEDATDTFRTVMVAATFAQDGVEQADGTGVLSVNVLDKAGVGVPQANVHIENATTGTNLTAQTGNDGNLILPGASPSGQEYEITVSKSGYYGAHTYEPAPLTTFDPIDEHAAVVAGDVNPFSIVMDLDADLLIRTVDPFGDPISGIGFTLVGGRRVAEDYTKPAEPVDVFGFSENAVTDGDGEVSYTDQSYGRYLLTLDAAAKAAYELLRSDQFAEPDTDFIDVEPGESREAEVILLDSTLESVLFLVTDDAATPVALEGASVRLTETLSGYDATVVTDALGQAFFPTEAPYLLPGTYSYEVTLSGYVTETGTVDVNGNGMRNETVALSSS